MAAVCRRWRTVKPSKSLNAAQRLSPMDIASARIGAGQSLAEKEGLDFHWSQMVARRSSSRLQSERCCRESARGGRAGPRVLHRRPRLQRTCVSVGSSDPRSSDCERGGKLDLESATSTAPSHWYCSESPHCRAGRARRSAGWRVRGGQTGPRVRHRILRQQQDVLLTISFQSPRCWLVRCPMIQCCYCCPGNRRYTDRLFN